MINRLLLIVTCFFALSSCTPDEPLIRSYDAAWRILVSGPDGLYTVSMPDGIAQSAVWKPSSAQSPYPVTRIVEYRDYLYLLRSAPEIVVLQRSDFSVVATINLVAPANGIAFANATTAYVSLSANNTVAIVDLTVNSVVDVIDVGSIAGDITAVGNQICVLLPETQEAKIIDSRTNAVEATLSLPTTKPAMVRGDGLGGVFCVVMNGAGKEDGSTEPKTAPTLSSIDVETNKVVATVDLSARESQGAEQMPKGLIINSNGFCYVPVQNGLLQIQARSPRRAAAVQFDDYGGVWYDAARAQILCVHGDGKTVDVFDEFAEKKTGGVILLDSANCLVGIASK